MQTGCLVEIRLFPENWKQWGFARAPMKLQRHTGDGGFIEISQWQVAKANAGKQCCYDPKNHQQAPGEGVGHGLGAYRGSTVPLDLGRVGLYGMQWREIRLHSSE